MTAFCIFSLLESTPANLIPTVLDDGTLSSAYRDELSRFAPQTRFLNY